MKATVLLIAALALTASAVFLRDFYPASTSTHLDHASNTAAADKPVKNLSDSVAQEQDSTASSIGSDTSSTTDSKDTITAAQPNESDTESITQDSFSQDSIDVLELGKQPLDEVSFRYWVSRLRSDPLLLQSALTEYLENTDSTRARNLAAILGEVNSPQVLDAATQLSQSTDTTAQLNGLELLARLQPNNTHARDNSIDLLATQSDPALLVATLNVFATPAQTVSPQQRQLILDHAQLLTTHDDANVRALSISTISRWGKGNSDIAATIGLNDTDGAVRANSAASLIGVRNPSGDAREGLLFIAANEDEPKTTRQLALYALSTMPLTESEKQRYEALEVEVRRTR